MPSCPGEVIRSPGNAPKQLINKSLDETSANLCDCEGLEAPEQKLPTPVSVPAGISTASRSPRSPWIMRALLLCLLLPCTAALVPSPAHTQQSTKPSLPRSSVPAHPNSPPRRAVVQSLATVVVTGTTGVPLAQAANPFVKDRRQLELCLVAVLRAVYWAQGLGADLQSTTTNLDTKKQRYLEARLGAKAMLTGKIGGGANYQVFTLSTLQLPDCLRDLEAYANVRSFDEKSREFYESMASLVEFDGMDTLTDTSPRSSLTLKQYNPDKETYVRRILAERVVPIGQQIIQAFTPENVAIAERYIQQNYPNEVYPHPQVVNSD